MVGVAQLVEHQIVALRVVGSSPITHPVTNSQTGCFILRWDSNQEGGRGNLASLSPAYSAVTSAPLGGFLNICTVARFFLVTSI